MHLGELPIKGLPALFLCAGSVTASLWLVEDLQKFPGQGSGGRGILPGV